MSETQKNFVKFWTKLLVVVAIAISILVGMFLEQTWAFIIAAILTVVVTAFIITIWVAERIYLWRIMGVLTPEQYNVAKWYKYSLLNGGPAYVIKMLESDEEPNEWHISVFKKIEKEVKIPKFLMEKA